MIRQLLAFMGLTVLLVACSSSPSPNLPPVELEDLVNAIRIDISWENRIGKGAGEKYLRLKPAIDDGKGFIADYTGQVMAFDVVSGKVLCKAYLAVPIASGPSVVQGRLLLGTSQGEVLMLNADDGKVIWRHNVSSEVLSTPIGADDTVIVRTVDGRLYGLNFESGKQLWTYGRSVPILTLRGTSRPLVVDNIVISGFDSGKLVALTREHGTLLWETTVAVPRGRTELERIVDMDADPVVMEGIIYAVTYQGRIAAVELTSGRLMWARDISVFNSMAIDAYRVYLSDGEGLIWALDRYNGATLWKQNKLLRRRPTAPVFFNDHLIVGDYNGYLHWLSREDGHLVAREKIFDDVDIGDEESERLFEKYSNKVYNILASPVVAEDLLIAVDRHGLLTAYKISEL